MHRKLFCYLVVVFLLSACVSKSPDYFQAKGREVILELIEELQEVDTLEDLLGHLPQLRTLFDQLVGVMIEARRWQIKQHQSRPCPWQPTREDIQLSHELSTQLKRLYAIPMAREMIEKSQQPALEKLDAFEKKIAKKQS